MLLRDLLISSLRRWYLLLAGLVLTAAGGYLAYGAMAPTYEAEASIVLIPPDAAVTVGDNPYLYLGGLDQALGVLQVKMNSTEVAEPLLERHPRAEYVVSNDPATSGPIMLVTVTGRDADDVLSLLQSTIDVVPDTLLSLQDDLDVTTHSRITSLVLAIDDTAAVSHRAQYRALIVVVGGGAAGTVLLTGLVDRLLTTRRRRIEDELAVCLREVADGSEVETASDATATVGRLVHP